MGSSCLCVSVRFETFGQGAYSQAAIDLLF